ncbi:sensor histidine kinase [Diaminobutyricimonas aerilata]|nr:sensor histidine kinase [Diaminobutyricimonas aerilata]
MDVSAVAGENPRAPGWNPFAVPRTRGQWWSDGIAFTLALLIWWLYGFAWSEGYPAVPDWAWPLDRALGLVACLLLWWARSRTLTVGVVALLPTAFSLSATFAVLAIMYRCAATLRPRVAAPLIAVYFLFGASYHLIAPVPGLDWVGWVIVMLAVHALVLTLGLLTRARAAVIDGIRREASLDRARYEARLGDVRRAERERIAREMHDVLAHRISLLSVHAGALEYRSSGRDPDARALRADEVHGAAMVIRENAHRAIDDLREVLSVLRDGGEVDELGVSPAQPTAEDLPALLDDARAAGQRVMARVSIPPTVPDGAQRTVYRVVQEGLTNARKHAPGSVVEVCVHPDRDAVVVTVVNPAPVGVTESEIPGAGAGLVGLAERVRLAGGNVEYGIRAGEFRLAARVPVVIA